MSNTRTITHLREKLFDTIDALNREDNPLDIERAAAIVSVADSIIESAKVEVAAMKIAGGQGSGFVDMKPALPPAGGEPRGHERLSHVNGGRKS